ncbi:MAG: membrane protein insertase YidC [Cytophagaceae bacterium]|jgi:YidC/Oxa1 family membrane protein insertase|nr:membrane protein insertase YidC [Cytophagaceae bacterium]
MDRNTIIGFVLITIILIGWGFLGRTPKEQLEREQRQRDSLQQVEVMRKLEAEVKLKAQSEPLATADTTVQTGGDSLRLQAYGMMAPYINGEQNFYTLENEKVKMTLTNKGGKIYSVELKDYKTWDGKPLILFDGADNKFGFPFVHNTRNFNTNDLFFNVREINDTSVVFELNSGNNELLAFIYELPNDEYMSRFYIQTRNMGRMIATPRGSMEFEWTMKVPSFEKGRQFEQQYSSIYYKYYGGEVDYLSPNRNGSEDFRTRMNWVGFKSQYFSSVLIADKGFEGGRISAEIEKMETSPFLRYNTAELAVLAENEGEHVTPFRFYFGPNHFYTLKNYGDELELNRLVELGWAILGWINKFAVIPVFNFLERYISSYGIIILILTILLKLVISPLTYKSYLSSAKMKVLKPQIDEINAKIPADKAMERQQATMALYKRAGVNPMGGCFPMLLQLPIIIAVFRFFPAAIELRQKSFLWANDLSAYDSILDLPFRIPMYGTHVSLFTLLMAITTVISTKLTMSTQPSQQMPGMKMMQYLMPVMMLIFFNQYASGLSYYYFLSTLIGVLQTVLIKQFVNEEKLLAKLTANQKKPVKKSAFTQRLEQAAKQQSQMRNQIQAGNKNKKK